MARSKEPIFWSLFAAGGAVAAFVLPAFIFLTGFSPWVNWPAAETALQYRKIAPILHHWAVRGFLFLVIFTTLFHCAHRLKFTIPSLLRMHGTKAAFGAIFYLAALAGTIWGATILWRM